MIKRILKPTKQKKFNKKVFGFDIETTSRKNDFYMASIWSDNPELRGFFYDREKLIKHFTQHRFRNAYIVASNLQFDFFEAMRGMEELEEFRFLWRGSDLLSAITYVTKSGKFSKIKPKDETSYKLTFIDTGNFLRMKVKKLGKIIGCEKLKKPRCMGRIPENDEEREELETYCMRDSEVSARFFMFLAQAFSELGADVKATIASTAKSLFTNKYLDRAYYRHPVHILDLLFNAYYGGHTEAFSRGVIPKGKKFNYYDVNSLYPSVMSQESYPDPNTWRFNRMNTPYYIMNYEGVSEVEIRCPENMKYPLLPYKYDNKLFFPVGMFRSWQSHVELRRALELGYEILKVHQSVYYTKTCAPFREYVEDLYAKRLLYKKQKSPMEHAVKLLLNSLYGKFAQKYRNRDDLQHASHFTIEKLEKYDEFEHLGDYIRVKEGFREPPVFTIPIWSIYVTAYARLRLHALILESSPVYVDTDSIVTEKEMPTGKGLGELKMEMPITSGLIVRAKCYAFRDDESRKKYLEIEGALKNQGFSGEDLEDELDRMDSSDCGDAVKLKGVGRRLSFEEFSAEMTSLNPNVGFEHFVKFRESLRRGLKHNEVVEIFKRLDLNDNKREWGGAFDGSWQESNPARFVDGRLVSETFINPNVRGERNGSSRRFQTRTDGKCCV